MHMSAALSLRSRGSHSDYKKAYQMGLAPG